MISPSDQTIVYFIEDERMTIERCQECMFRPVYGGCVCPPALECRGLDRPDGRTGYFTLEKPDAATV